MIDYYISLNSNTVHWKQLETDDNRGNKMESMTRILVTSGNNNSFKLLSI